MGVSSTVRTFNYFAQKKRAKGEKTAWFHNQIHEHTNEQRSDLAIGVSTQPKRG
jgi:hypothetical protein